MAHRSPRTPAREPVVLLVPGLDGSGPSHWQSIWAERWPDCRKVNLGTWSKPHRNTWINNLNLAIRDAGRPVVLVAHSLGCLAVAWWASFEQREWASPVVGALLVAPPEVDFFPHDERIRCFSPTPASPLPLPSRLIASRDDPWIGFHTAQMLARRWGSTFVDAGATGHINADSGLGHWEFGRTELAKLLRQDVRAASRGAAATPPIRAIGASDEQRGLRQR